VFQNAGAPSEIKGYEVFRVGLGLISMRERLRIVGGTMGVISSPGQGTDIEVVVRFRRDA
jgi:signal transduction histidine kinase